MAFKNFLSGFSLLNLAFKIFVVVAILGYFFLNTSFLSKFNNDAETTPPVEVAMVATPDKAEMEKMFREYLLTNPEIIQEAIAVLQNKVQQQRENDITAIIQNQIETIENPKGLFINGPADADVTLVEFFDYNCTYCKSAFKDVNRLLAEDKKLKVVMYELPILAPSSLTAARASLAAMKQNKYWEFHSSMIGNNGSLTDELVFDHAKNIGLDIEQLKIDMVSREVEQALVYSAQLADELKVNGTPAFIIGGKLIPGAIGYQNMFNLIAEARAKIAAQKASAN
ncbi:MAG: DsbA family protein [Rhizobiales bacterium]|nr:DsbA family protein [Hyphomicrobiales bacterium]NRB12959.1 DsbA family protein [Hyphomicrobiales bacterium]